MIIYNPKDWISLIFAFHKSDTLRIMLPSIIAVAVFTGIVAYVETDLLHLNFKNTTIVHQLAGFVLSMLLVFRTNSAYDRWWEGRKIWGAFVNDSRNMALKINALVQDPAQRDVLRILIKNYIVATKDSLRGKPQAEALENCHKYPNTSYDDKKHLPNQVMKNLYVEIQQLVKNQVISQEQMLYLNNELQGFSNNMGACERIKKTPIPYSYNIFLKKVIFFYILTMPFGFVMEFGYWAMGIVPALFYVFASIEIIAEEIEDPFGLDPNDLPLDNITETIHLNVDDILA